MKLTLSFFLSLFAILFSSLGFSAPEKFNLDPEHTYVLWHISHFGFSTQSGKWYASGTLELDKDNPQNSKVDATIKVADFITGIPALDKHLRGKDFFAVQEFPTAKFVSNKVELTGSDTAKIVGMLTLHGVTKEVTLDAKLNKAGVSPITNKMTAGFAATTTINRSDFGITMYSPGLNDKVTLDIEAEATKA